MGKPGQDASCLASGSRPQCPAPAHPSHGGAGRWLLLLLRGHEAHSADRRICLPRPVQWKNRIGTAA